jgi:transcription elongation factor Elf1
MTDVRRNKVRKAFACPNCGERDADNLVNSADGDDLVFCESCGCTYALDLGRPTHEPGEGNPVVFICGPDGRPGTP